MNVGRPNVEAVITREPLISRLSEIKAPALVLHGTADNVFPVSEAETLASALPGSGDAVIIEDGAHFVNVTDADAVNDHIDGFLASQLTQQHRH